MRHPVLNIELTLGEEYMVGFSNTMAKCRLIKTTAKGFNFLNLETNKCVLKQHLYAKGYFTNPIPSRKNTFKFTIFVDWLRIYEIDIKKPDKDA